MYNWRAECFNTHQRVGVAIGNESASRQTDYNKTFTCCVLMCDNPPVDTDLEKSQSSLM